MSFILDLPPEVETRLQQEATRQGVPAAAVALRLFTENLPPAPKEVGQADKTEQEKQRIATIRAAAGSLAHVGASAADLQQEPQAAPVFPVLQKPVAKNLQIPAEEWERNFTAWCESHSRDTPAIDPENLRRAKMYEDRV